MSTTSKWRIAARHTIAGVLSAHCCQLPASLPAETQKELCRYIRAAYPFGAKKYYPYRVWRQEVRRTFGLPAGYSRRSKKPRQIYTHENVMPAMREWASKNGLLQ